MGEFNEMQISIPARSFLTKRIAEAHSTYDVTRIVSCNELQVSRTCQIARRSLDIVVALVGLSLLALLLGGIALLIFLEDRGPIFYRQARIGLYGQPFYVYKLRSMIVNADDYLYSHSQLLETWQQRGKLYTDPRVTGVGRFLRRTSLDEMPQMLNVLRGEMSLVGPRPVQCSEMATFGDLAILRQMVKPGLTGLWQISGRSSIDYEQRCLLDCTYVIERSLKADISILFKTLPVVLQGSGAC